MGFYLAVKKNDIYRKIDGTGNHYGIKMSQIQKICDKCHIFFFS